MKALSDNFIEALIADPVKYTPMELVCDCGSKLDNGSCLNPECEWDAPEETFPCKWCGCCSDPSKCVWSIICPICNSKPKEHCVEGTKLVGLHPERWEVA